MTNREGVNLTRIMFDEDILRIARVGTGFTLHMRGDVMGTGATVGEAYANALAERAVKTERIAA
jgi:hypothetical protein